LQDHEFQRIGGREVIHVDVRVMASTHRDLEKAIVDGTFREDLYYRLNVVNVELPPLRDRTEDILQMAEFLLKKHVRGGRAMPRITPALKYALLSHSWPGNVRELENLIRNLLVFDNADALAARLNAKAQKKPMPIQATDSGSRLVVQTGDKHGQGRVAGLEQVMRSKRQEETEAIIAALNSTRWNRKQAAALLEVDYKAFLYKMKKLGVPGKAASPAIISPQRPEAVAAAGGR
jgi:DNA-binding NtrC family response regulator